jgi:hypothetical protein
MARQKDSEQRSPWVVVALAAIALCGLALAAFAIYVAAVDLVGESLVDTVGISRPAPVWLAWVAIAIALAGGLQLFWSNARGLYRIARGGHPTLRRARKRK